MLFSDVGGGGGWLAPDGRTPVPGGAPSRARVGASYAHGVPKGPKLLSVIFAVAGVAHFAVPAVFESIVPAWLPRRRALVLASGVAELGCAAALATSQPWAPTASTALLLGVWPANIQMAVDASRGRRPWWYQAGLWARVPLQLPMVRMARS